MATNPGSNERVEIAILAKAPIPGTTKTRLIPALGANDAAALQQRLVLRTVATALEARIGIVTIWCSPSTRHCLFQDIASKHPVQLREQCDGDLGDRMHATFVAASAAIPTLLVGVDCPALTPEHLRDCAGRLRSGDDAVFLPAEDGGYVLVGLRRHQRRLFEGIEWGGPMVMASTRQRLLELGLRWSEPETLWDLDRPDDLRRWLEIVDRERR